MSKGTRVLFDASVQEDVVSIGVYDDSNKIKLHKSYNVDLKCHESYKAEFIGLVTALEYCYLNEIKYPMLFTDNRELADKGIPNWLQEKYTRAELYWIPREFNRVADKLSKSSKNVSKKIKLTKVTKAYIKSFKYPDKLKFINAIAINDFRKKFLKLLESGSIQEFKEFMNKKYRAKDSSFLSLVVELEIYNTNKEYSSKKMIMDVFKKVTPISNAKLTALLVQVKLHKGNINEK